MKAQFSQGSYEYNIQAGQLKLPVFLDKFERRIKESVVTFTAHVIAQ